MIKARGKTIVVMGMHRSGTSMIAGVLYKFGVYLGDNLVIEARPGNPLGHYEDPKIMALNNKILNAAGGSWSNPPAYQEILELQAAYSTEVEGIVKGLKGKLCGWKDPRNSFTAELFLPFLQNPYFVVCYRETEEVTRSLLKRDKMPLAVGRELQGQYNQAIDQFFARNPGLNRLNLYYSLVTRAPYYWVKKIGSFLAIQVSDQQLKAAVRSILPNKELHSMEKQ